MLELTPARLKAAYQEALTMPQLEQVITLSITQFATDYPQRQPWQIGPFTAVPGMTFTPPLEDWEDPTDVGWRGTSVINPTLITHGENLHMFYRASPRMETLASRLGHATYNPTTGWTDNLANPVVYPTRDNEMLGCEDPTIYRAEGRYFLFYNGAWPIQPEHRHDLVFSGEVGCDINLAVSDDLLTWEKLGPVVPHDISGYWAKGAVIPRSGNGDAIRVGGEYLMFLSEGCFGKQVVGHSADMIHWTWEYRDYLILPEAAHQIHEVACAAVVDESTMLLDFFWEDEEGKYRAGQARYNLHEPFVQLELAQGGSLAWGGLIKYHGAWVFAQGWDAPRGEPRMFIYRSS